MGTAIPEFHDFVVTCLRWLLGLSVGALIGFLLGLISDIRFVRPPVTAVGHFLRAIPILGLMPFVQSQFGPSEVGKVMLIGWAVMFPVWFSLAGLRRQVPLDTHVSILGRRLGWKEKLRFYDIPRVVIAFTAAIEVAIGLAWLAVVAAEIMGTYSQGFWRGGLGYRVNDLVMSRSDYLGGAACLLCFGMLGLLSSWLWHLVKSSINKKIILSTLPRDFAN